MKSINNYLHKALITKNTKIRTNYDKILSTILNGFGFDEYCQSDNPEEDRQIIKSIKKWIDDYDVKDIYGPYAMEKDPYMKSNIQIKPELFDYITEDSIEYFNFNNYSWIEGGSNGILFKGEDILLGFTTKEL